MYSCNANRVKTSHTIIKYVQYKLAYLPSEGNERANCLAQPTGHILRFVPKPAGKRSETYLAISSIRRKERKPRESKIPDLTRIY